MRVSWVESDPRGGASRHSAQSLDPTWAGPSPEASAVGTDQELCWSLNGVLVCRGEAAVDVVGRGWREVVSMRLSGGWEGWGQGEGTWSRRVAETAGQPIPRARHEGEGSLACSGEGLGVLSIRTKPHALTSSRQGM